MNRLRTFAVVVLVATLAGWTGAAGQAPASAPTRPWNASITELRRVASLIPGARPARINFTKFAESRRTKNFSVEGAPPDPSVQARTAFQVMYPDSYVMVDSGMDIEVHRFFGRGVEEPYDIGAAALLARVVDGARLIVLTHEHGDHVAGVVHTPNAALLAPKTILTRTQVQTLLTSPQMPEIRLTPATAARYLVVDYDSYLPVAPGIALVKSPGHTPGSQMVYVSLASGREYLLIGDVTWHMDGVRQMKGKAAPWITEDAPSVLAQLQWLNDLTRSVPRLVIVASHDEEQHADLVRQRLLTNRLELK